MWLFQFDVEIVAEWDGNLFLCNENSSILEVNLLIYEIRLEQTKQ